MREESKTMCLIELTVDLTSKRGGIQYTHKSAEVEVASGRG